jgi:hypothetical protein
MLKMDDLKFRILPATNDCHHRQARHLDERASHLRQADQNVRVGETFFENNYR